MALLLVVRSLFMDFVLSISFMLHNHLFHTQDFRLGPLYEGSDNRKISSYTTKHKELQTDA